MREGMLYEVQNKNVNLKAECGQINLETPVSS